jgi:hypothetical protein
VLALQCDVVFSPDGKRLLLSVGSGSNVALDMFPEPKGGLQAWIRSAPLGDLGYRGAPRRCAIVRS